MNIVPAGIVGSLPRPEWLSQPAGVRIEWKLRGEELKVGQDDAVVLALHDQEQADLDLVTDGEQRRDHYLHGFVRHLPGFDYSRQEPKSTRGGRYQVPSPVITEPPRWDKPVLAEATVFARAHSNRPLKVTIPGPLTIVDSFHNATDLSEEQLARHLAGIVNQELQAVVAAGADIVQIDEPGFCGYLDKAAAWGVEVLDRCLEGIQAQSVVHICYGYGVPLVLEWKRHNQDWDQYAHLLPLLKQSRVDGLSLEFAASGVDPAVLAAAGDKLIWFGAIDVAIDSPVETAEQVAERLRGALKHIPPERLVASTDCGMIPLSRAQARAKMAALADGAELVRGSLPS